VKAAFAGVAIVAALLLQSALTRLAPEQARVLDPLLLVVVYCALSGGELLGMLAGAAAGWVQDVHFGGSVLGVGGLAKLMVGFATGLAGAHLLLTGLAPRLLVVFAATLLDALLFERLAALFGLRTHELSYAGLLARASLNAVAGAAAFELIDRRLTRARRA